LAGITLGKGTRFALMEDGRWKMEDSGLVTRHSSLVTFLVGLIVLLAFSSFWHLDMTNNYYHGPRWMGLWDNPNIYGMLMGTGGTLAIGLLAANEKLKIKNVKFNRFLGIALFMMGVGLVMSYSRGAWVATTMGLLYLAWSYGKLKWRWVLTVILVAAAVVCVFWHSTADDGPWYLKRLDFSRPSAQHRVAAWTAGFEIMRDHPFGVGWNQAVSVYDKNYSPPEGGAAAITMNSYLMLGTELGLPGLLCFVAYVALCFRNRPHLTLPHPQPLSNPIREGGVSPPAGSGEGIVMSPATRHLSLQAACRAGAIVLLVAFWFDGGLFTLATTAVFWILLELGAARGGKVDSGELMVDRPKAI
jgi:O-antigen ligase